MMNVIFLMKWSLVLFSVGLLSHGLASEAQSDSAAGNLLWLPAASSDELSAKASNKGLSPHFSLQSLQHEQLLDNAKVRLLTGDAKTELRFSLPSPDGRLVEVRVAKDNILPSKLQQKYPNILSLRGYLSTDKDSPAIVTLSRSTIRAMYLYNGEWVMLEPISRDADNRDYMVFKPSQLPIPEYWREHEHADTLHFHHSIHTNNPNDHSHPHSHSYKHATAKASREPGIQVSGDEIATFRIALTASGEYSAFFGGTRTAVLNEYVVLLGRINQLLLTDLAIQFQLAENSDQLIFLDAETDPFSNDDASADVDINQEVTDDTLGSSNYDIGHLLNTNGGGLAFVQSLCAPNFKARGYSGFPDFGNIGPTGEAFFINLVAHELGHQLGANHTFNGLGSEACEESQRTGDSAWEPGSGSTVMAYAGICAEQNLQQNSDPHFHGGSIMELRNTITNRLSLSNCGLENAFVDNPIAPTTPPQISISQNAFNIPADTPFLLSATGSDADGDSLSFIWEQIDAGGDIGATFGADEVQMDNGANPLFRSFSPSSSPIRYFPRLSDLLNGTTTFGETLPTTTRTLNFRLTVRDGNGGVNNEDVQVDVTNTGSGFTLDLPLADTLWRGNQQEVIRWQSADTELSPINCANVDILLDTNGGNTFDSTLLSQTDNDGEATITVPNISADSARLMLRCSDNIFFSVNPGSFAIATADPIAPEITGQNPISVDEDTRYTLTFSDLLVEDPDSAYPQGFSLTISAGENYTLEGEGVIPNADFNGELQVGVSINDGALDSNLFNLQINVLAVNDAPSADNDSVSVDQDSSDDLIDVLANDEDIDGDALTLVETDYTGAGAIVIEDNQLIYTPASGFSGEETFSYRVTDNNGGSASATVTIQVVATPVAPTPDPAPTPAASSGGGGGALYWLLGVSSLMLVIRLNARKRSYAD